MSFTMAQHDETHLIKNKEKEKNKKMIERVHIKYQTHTHTKINTHAQIKSPIKILGIQFVSVPLGNA